MSRKFWMIAGPLMVVLTFAGFWVHTQLSAVAETAAQVEATTEAVAGALETAQDLEVDSLEIDTEKINTQLTSLGAGIGNAVRTAIDSAGGS